MIKSKLYIDAEVSLTQEDFVLFNELTSKLQMSIGDVIISLARSKAQELKADVGPNG